MKLLSKFWRHVCCIYTVSAMLFLLLNLAIAGTLSDALINAQAFLLVFVFAVCFALANLVYGIHAMAHGIRLALHFVIVTGFSYLLLFLPSNSGATSSGKLLIFILMVLLYWLCMGVYLALSRAVRKQAPKQTEYQSVFKK